MIVASEMCNLTVKRIKLLFLVSVLLLTLHLFGVFTHIFEKDFYEDFHYPYDGDITGFIQQLRNNEVPDVAPINDYKYKYLKDGSSKCEKDVQIRLVYIVKSCVSNLNRRAVIRKTWGYQKRFSDVEIRTVFILGKKNNESLQRSVDEESTKFDDIIQADFADTYFNNTIKTMMGFKWAVNFCANSQFYMFVDDDYYVSTKNVLLFIRHPTKYPGFLEESVFSLKNLISRKTLSIYDYELPPDVRLYSGYTFNSAPHRHITSKWQVSLEEYPYHMWPPYITAGAYVLSKESLFDMYYASFYTKHFRFDDIYVGLLAYKAKIEPFHSDHFHYYKKPYSPNNYNYTVATHGYDNPDELFRVWNEQKRLGHA